MGLNDEGALRIVIDIETIGSPDCAEYLDPVKAPDNYKDEAKIKAYCDEKRVKQIEQAGLEADLCEVVAVSWMVAESHTRPAVFTRAAGDEGDLLSLLWGAIGLRSVIGFNCLGFDLPVLIRRSQLLNIAHPRLNLDRYRTPHVDLLERLTWNGKLTYRSLGFYCRRFGIPSEDTTSGKDIAALVAANDWLAVGKHCQADVEKTALLAQRLGWLKEIPRPQLEAVL